jgi:hypothetical protein
MRTIKTLGSAGTLGLLVAGSIIFGSAQAATAAAPPNCDSVPANTFPGSISTATSFESNGFCNLAPSTGGTGTGVGTATISTSQKKTGTHSAKLHVTDTPGSIANLSTTPAFPAGTKTVYADGWFNITTAGVAGNDVPYFRFFSGSTRIADTYRYNSNGQMWLRVTTPSGFVYTKLTAGSVSLSAWHRVGMRVTTNGSTATVQVWLDNALKYSSSSVQINATSLSKVQLGAEHNRQMGDEYIDDVTIKR